VGDGVSRTRRATMLGVALTLLLGIRWARAAAVASAFCVARNFAHPTLTCGRAPSWRARVSIMMPRVVCESQDLWRVSTVRVDTIHIVGRAFVGAPRKSVCKRTTYECLHAHHVKCLQAHHVKCLHAHHVKCLQAHHVRVFARAPRTSVSTLPLMHS
jgi:hypothetical protein